jgi:hypothetical protein
MWMDVEAVQPLWVAGPCQSVGAGYLGSGRGNRLRGPCQRGLKKVGRPGKARHWSATVAAGRCSCECINALEPLMYPGGRVGPLDSREKLDSSGQPPRALLVSASGLETVNGSAR